MLAPRFSASGWARQAAEHGATLGSLFAAPVRMILAQPPGQNEQRSSLRAVLFAQNLTDGQAAAFEQRFGTRLLQLYGMTETVLPPTVNPDSPERRWPSIGRALPGVTLRVAGENGTPVPPGTAGELLVRGVPGVTWRRAITATRTRPLPPSAMAGCTPGTWPGWTATASPTSSTGSRT